MSMVYQRTEQRDGYQLITSVSDKGTYLQFSLAPDGTAYNIHTDNIYRMGWASVAEFLRLRPGFAKVEVVKTRNVNMTLVSGATTGGRGTTQRTGR